MELVAFLLSFAFRAGSSAKLTLKKTPTEDRTFTLSINIKDNAGIGVTQKFEGERTKLSLGLIPPCL